MAVVGTILKEVAKITFKELKSATILKYADLFNFSKSELLRAGFSESQILNKLNKLYLREGRQLIINENTGQTLSRALRQLKRGIVDQGVSLPKPALQMYKEDMKNLNNLIKNNKKLFNKDSLPYQWFERAKTGEMYFSEVHNAMKSYFSNPQLYIEQEKITKDLELFIDNTKNNMSYIRNPEIRAMYDETYTGEN